MEISPEIIQEAKKLDDEIANLVTTGHTANASEALGMRLDQEKIEQNAASPEAIQEAVTVIENLPGQWPIVPAELQASFAIHGRITSDSVGKDDENGDVYVMGMYFRNSVMDREYIIDDDSFGNAEEGEGTEIILVVPSEGHGDYAGIVEDYKQVDGARELTGQRRLKEDELTAVMTRIQALKETGNFREGSGLDYH